MSFVPKYINLATGEVCADLKHVLLSIISDLRHYPKAYTWVWWWMPYKWYVSH